MEIVDVIHDCKDGWHKFTSPQIPGLYIVAAADDLEEAYADIPRAIAELIFADRGRRPVVRAESSYAEYLKTLPASRRPSEIRHYSVEFLAA